MTALAEADEIARAAWVAWTPTPEAPVYLRHRPIWPDCSTPVLPPRPLPRRGDPSGSAAGWLLVALVVLPLVTWLVMA